MGEDDTHLLELLSLSLVLDVTPSASQQERDSDSEHAPDRSHVAQHSCSGSETLSCQPSQATGDLPCPGCQWGGTAPTLSPSYLVLVPRALFTCIQRTDNGWLPNPTAKCISQGCQQERQGSDRSKEKPRDLAALDIPSHRQVPKCRVACCSQTPS